MAVINLALIATKDEMLLKDLRIPALTIRVETSDDCPGCCDHGCQFLYKPDSYCYLFDETLETYDSGYMVRFFQHPNCLLISNTK